VRKRLQSWRTKSYLRADDEPALYLYQYTVDDVTVRGLIGVVALRQEDERVILPHEDVMPGPVDDRMVLMRTTESNLEPILLVHEGTEGLRAVLVETTHTEPLADFEALDRSRHQLWAITDLEVLGTVAEQVRHAQALIADGHHRYAAYLRLQQETRDLRGSPEFSPNHAGVRTTNTGESPWDYGLAMLVDQHDYPLTVGPIHRTVGALTMADIQELCAERDDRLTSFPDRESALAALADSAAGSDTASFVVSDGRVWALLSTPRTHGVDAAVLHESLFEAWEVAEEQVGYHHRLDQALQVTERQPALVVAVQPPGLAQVMDAAARGVRMPRKSTSFSPKPRMGVVMRDLRDA
ncbi:MAG: DUF1015 family protein, partial [Actinomycetes bacterium]